jgi:hypothetical protein
MLQHTKTFYQYSIPFNSDNKKINRYSNIFNQKIDELFYILTEKGYVVNNINYTGLEYFISMDFEIKNSFTQKEITFIEKTISNTVFKQSKLKGEDVAVAVKEEVPTKIIKSKGKETTKVTNEVKRPRGRPKKII